MQSNTMCSELVLSVRSFYKDDPRCRLFDLFIAAVVKHPGGGDRPVFQGAAIDFVVDLFKKLREEKQVTKESIAADANAYIEIQRGVRRCRPARPNHTLNSVTVQKAIAIAREAFDFVAPPLVNSVLIRLESLPLPQSKDIRKVSLDAFLALMLEEWITEKERWENRLAPLFDKYSTLGSVLAPPSNSNDESMPVEPEFDSSTVSTSITPAVWDVVMKATAAAMDDKQIRLERTKRKRKLQKAREAREAASKTVATLDASVAKVGRSLRVITMEAFHKMMQEVQGEDYFQARATSYFEDARAIFEQARWDRKREPWKEGKDKTTGRRFYYHEHSRETSWTLPELKRDKGETGSREVAFCMLTVVVQWSTWTTSHLLRCAFAMAFCAIRRSMLVQAVLLQLTVVNVQC